MALANLNSLKLPQTQLQQLLEEINFQRTKEMRQLLKDDGGFVVLQGTTYWTDLFVRHFLFQSEPVHNIDSDDLLFFVRKKHVKGTSRHLPKFDTEVDVFRKDSRKLPIGDPDVDWEETVYLNMVIHQFDYTLTLAICTRTSPKELQVLRRHSQRVYASPSRRKMDTKGEGEEMTYPHICFMVDNFDEVFSDILVRDGEMVCVELVASDKDGSIQGVIFLGSIRYDALKKVYDARQSSLSTKVAQRMTFGLFSSGANLQSRCEFVRMKGPQGKGHAEMAVTKPKGSGVETPTSEPGFCATDMWDEWDEDPDDYYNYRHQRRLSDPSANLNNFTRYGWRAKNTTNTSASTKARSENEGLDSLANEISEIEAGDLRDDRPASSALNSTTPTCCNCFGHHCKPWTDKKSEQMSDIYCRTCDEANSPACLTNINGKKNKQKQQNLLHIENELIYLDNKKLLQPIKDNNKTINKNELLLINGKNNNQNIDEYEIADDATSLNNDIINDTVSKIEIINKKDTKFLIKVRGKEELPAEQKDISQINLQKTHPIEINTNISENHINNIKCNDKLNINEDFINGNNGKLNNKNLDLKSSTLPKMKKSIKTSIHQNFYNKSLRMVPKHITPDGTSIYYWCNLPKKALKELDDGAYNPLWATRGFTQTFHFWKENRRQQSTPLNAFLTYVTLPWWSIAKDLLDHRETPILTF